jgi:hypothetical protein
LSYRRLIPTADVENNVLAETVARRSFLPESPSGPISRLAVEATTVVNAPNYAAVVCDLFRLAQEFADAARFASVATSAGDILDEIDALDDSFSRHNWLYLPPYF